MWTTRGLHNAFCPWVFWIVEVLTLVLPTGHSDTAADMWLNIVLLLGMSVHRTVVLVFSTKPWREQKGHLLATITNIRAGYLHPVEELQATPGAVVRIWTSQLKHCPPCPHFVVKFMKAAWIVSPPPHPFYLWPGSVLCMFHQVFTFMQRQSLHS